MTIGRLTGQQPGQQVLAVLVVDSPLPTAFPFPQHCPWTLPSRMQMKMKIAINLNIFWLGVHGDSACLFQDKTIYCFRAF